MTFFNSIKIFFPKISINHKWQSSLTDKKVPLFSLVDDTGNTVQSEQLGLLLYRGGTVCNYEIFDNQTAEAICRQMNFSSAIEWKTGIESDIQLRYEIAISIMCPVAEWEPERCTIMEFLIVHEDCFHKRDVFLKCTGL